MIWGKKSLTGTSVWLNLKDLCVAFQHWLCSSSVLLWKEELVPIVSWVPSKCPSPFGSPCKGSWCFCLGMKVLNCACGMLAKLLEPFAAWRLILGAAGCCACVSSGSAMSLCPGEVCHQISHPCWGRHVEQPFSLGDFCLYFHLLK